MTEFSAELVAADGGKLSLSGEQRVGRSADCDITIDDPRVSRGHAVFRVKSDCLTVEDLGSANGTQVNGKTASGETTLRDGDTVSFEKHNFVVVLAGGSAEMDATVFGDMGDATVVSAPADAEPQPAPEPAPEPQAAPEPPPPEEPKPEPSPEPKPPPKPAPASSDLPGSWIDSGTSDSTRVLSLDAIGESESERIQMERASDLPHLILVAESGVGGEAVELQPGDGSEPDVWEIGRDPACEVALEEPSVSARHAQLIHDGGRWKLVNLVSANGIFVNGEKRLTAYLADGDEIRLGIASLVFRTAAGDVSAAPKQPAPASTAGSGGTGTANKGRNIAVIAVVLLLAAAAAAYFLL